jgi:hypothetical protein
MGAAFGIVAALLETCMAAILKLLREENVNIQGVLKAARPVYATHQR